MANLYLAALETLRDYLLAVDGLNAKVYEISVRDQVNLPELRPEQFLIRHVEPEMGERTLPTIYPAVFLYCERLENRLERKFSEFAGRVFATADVRVTADGVEQLDGMAARLTEALTRVLAEHYGQWTDELSFDGRYEVRFDPLKAGGDRYMQRARVRAELLAFA